MKVSIRNTSSSCIFLLDCHKLLLAEPSNGPTARSRFQHLFVKAKLWNVDEFSNLVKKKNLSLPANISWSSNIVPNSKHQDISLKGCPPPRFVRGGGEDKFSQPSKFNISRLRDRMKIGVRAFERYRVVECAWGFWSVFQALAHIRHAFENVWSKMAKILSQLAAPDGRKRISHPLRCPGILESCPRTH